MKNYKYQHHICFSFSQCVKLSSNFPLSHPKKWLFKLYPNHSPVLWLTLPDLLSTNFFSSLCNRLPHHYTSPFSTARCCQLLTNSCSPRSLPPLDREACKHSQRVTEQISTVFELEDAMYCISVLALRTSRNRYLPFILLPDECFKNTPLSLLFIFEKQFSEDISVRLWHLQWRFTD